MADAALSTAEIESLRHHLGYGNIGIGAYPSTPDGFLELFRDVVAPNLTSGEETTSVTAITAGSTTVVTPVSMTDIAVHERLVVDVGDAAEIVTVRSLPSVSTFTAAFTKGHPATGYPIVILSGVSRLRLLLHSADAAWQKAQGSAITTAAGLKSVGRGAVEWFGVGAVLTASQQHYLSIAQQISDLVRVLPRWVNDGGCSGQLEVY